MKDLLGQRRNDHDLLCCICIFTVPDNEVVPIAISILNGNAVCNEHIYLVRDNDFMARVAHARSYVNDPPANVEGN